MVRTKNILCVLAVVLAAPVFAHGGATPLPAQQRLVDYTVTTGMGNTSIIIENNGQVIAETFTPGHEFPDTVDDRDVEFLTCGDLYQIRTEIQDLAPTKAATAPDQVDWSPLLGGIYHVYSINGNTQVLKRWGGRMAGYALTNSSPDATALVQRLDALYQKYFSAN